MKVYEFITASRSGHHVMVNWVIKNMLGEACDMRWKFTRMANFKDFLYVNEGSISHQSVDNYIGEHIDALRTICIDYENAPVNFSVFTKNHFYKGPDKDFIRGKIQKKKTNHTDKRFL